MRTLTVALTLLLTSCSLSAPKVLKPWTWGQETPAGTEDVDPVTETAVIWFDMLMRFSYLGIILVLFVPGVRTPFLNVIKAIFGMIALPFEYIELRYTLWAAKKYPDRYILVSKLEDEDDTGD